MTTQILIVGAGPAGMAAAVRARECGATVLIIDENPSPGGQIWRGGPSGAQAKRWFKAFRASGAEVLTEAQLVSIEGRTALIETREFAVTVQVEKSILATGSRELFLPFPGWTLPGVMGAGGLQALVKSGLPIAGKRVIVAGTGPLLIAVASYLKAHGAHIPLIAEQAPSLASFVAKLLTSPAKAIQAATLFTNVPYELNTWIEAAEGGTRVERVRLRNGQRTWTEQVDYAAVGYGLVAQVSACDGQDPDVYQIPTGPVDLALVEGEIAGYTVAGRPDKAKRLQAWRNSQARFSAAINRAFALRPELKQLPQHDTIVCRCEDVSYGRLQAMHSFREAKLHTRCGMGPCQGRVCGPACEFLFGWQDHRSSRPPIYPARLETLSQE